jgi:aspartate/methionine/tyrosine aminotransferase
VSELIVMSMQALLNNGDEVLVPARTTRCGPPP